MAPSFNIDDKYQSRAKKLLDAAEIPYVITSKNSAKSKYLELPESGLLVPKEKILYNNGFYETQQKLHDDNKKMLNLNEFREFLKVAKKEDTNLFNEITQVRSPWRAEWLDADFKIVDKGMYMNYHIFDSKGNIIQKSEKLDKKTLKQNKIPGISLDSWLNNSTPQGLPNKFVKSGDLYYWAPMNDNNSVALFNANSYGAYLIVCRYSSDSVSALGVRAAEQL